MKKKLIVLLTICICFGTVGCSVFTDVKKEEQKESETNIENTQNLQQEEQFFDDDLQNWTEGEATTEADETYEGETGMEYIEDDSDMTEDDSDMTEEDFGIESDGGDSE